MSNSKPSDEEESFEYSDSALDDDFKFDISSNEDYYEEDTIDYLTPTILPEDAVKDCDQIVNIEFPSLESLSKENPIEMEPIYFDRFKITPQFIVDSTADWSVSCYLICEEQIILDISLYIPSLGKVAYNRYCSFGKSSNSQKLSPALFSLSEVPKEAIPNCHFSFHKTPSEKLCRQYFNCVGLVNSGMTCYLNSLIQCLFYLKNFRGYVFNCNTSPLAKKSQIVKAMRVLFTRMQISYLPVSTRDLTTAFGWDSIEYLFQQHDVQELTRLLLSGLDDVTDKKASSFFKGKNRKTIVTSQKSKPMDEEFSDLSLTVNGISTLEESIAKYYEPFMLTGDDQYELEDGTKCDAEVQTTVIESPTILSLHLRRFEYSKEMIKIYSRFEYGESLIFNGEEYELLSIIAHNGSVRGGHYNAFVKMDEHWTNFDDETVRHCEPYEALDQNFGNGEKGQFTAYVLFYGKKGVNDIDDPLPPQDVIDGERERLSKTKITIYYDCIEKFKEIQVKKDLDSASFIQELSKETKIPADKIVVRDIDFNTYSSNIIEEPVPTLKNYFYVDDSPLIPVWVQFWIPNYEIISLGTFHITPDVNTPRKLGREVLQKVGMIPMDTKKSEKEGEEEKSEDNQISLNCFYILEDDFTPIDNSFDHPIEQSCWLLYQFNPESVTLENVTSFKDNLKNKIEKGVFKSFTKLEDSNLPQYESHLNLLADEIVIKDINDFIKYMKDIFNFEFLSFDEPENEEKKLTLSLSKHLTYEQLLKCISRKVSGDEEQIDINKILLFLPDKFFKGPDHKALNSEVITTIEALPSSYDGLYYEILDEDMRFFQRADVTILDSKGAKIQRVPILFPRGPTNTISDLRQKIAEIIGHPNFYLYYVKGAMPVFISSTIEGANSNENDTETETMKEGENQGQNDAAENKDDVPSTTTTGDDNGDGNAIDNNEKQNSHIDYIDCEIQFDYKIFAQVFDRNEVMKIKHMNEDDGSFDYRALDEDDVLKLKVMRCDQYNTFYKSPYLPFILFTEKGKTWKDIKDMFPNDKIEMMKQKSRSLEPIDVDENKKMTENDIFAIVHNKSFNTFLFGENSLLKIKNEIDEFNNEKYIEEEEEEEEEEAAEEEEKIEADGDDDESEDQNENDDEN